MDYSLTVRWMAIAKQFYSFSSLCGARVVSGDRLCVVHYFCVAIEPSSATTEDEPVSSFSSFKVDQKAFLLAMALNNIGPTRMQKRFAKASLAVLATMSLLNTSES